MGLSLKICIISTFFSCQNFFCMKNFFMAKFFCHKNFFRQKFLDKIFKTLNILPIKNFPVKKIHNLQYRDLLNIFILIYIAYTCVYTLTSFVPVYPTQALYTIYTRTGVSYLQIFRQLFHRYFHI